MSRVLRSQCPGGIFHITARTQGKQEWFVPELRSHIAEVLIDGVCSAGAYLIAYAIMPNHYHLLLAQSTRTLGWMMKPVNQRVALMLQRFHKIDGHVFGQRFFSKQCDDANYVRTAIMYTHHNPVKAGLCASVGDYAWTSHGAFHRPRESQSPIAVGEVLQFFQCALNAPRDVDVARSCYLQHMDWWSRKKKAELAKQDFTEPAPRSRGGDQYFSERYATPSPALARPPERDLRDAAILLLGRMAPQVDIELLRRSYGGRKAVELRNQLIAALSSQNYRGNSIANYFRVHPSVVARLNSAIRWGKAG
jgi:putative transposase